MNIEDMSADEIANFLAAKAAQPGGSAKVPEPVQLGEELAKQGADLHRLIQGIDVVVGVLNGTAQNANQQFWTAVTAEHPIDTERFLWTFEAGCLVPSPRTAPAGQPGE